MNTAQAVKPSSNQAFQITIERMALLRALGHVQGVVERRNTIPILGNVKLDAKGGQLTLTGTDLDVAVMETVAAQTQAEGQVTVPAHMFYDIVRKLPDGAQISLTLDPATSRVSVVAGRSSFYLACLPVEDFPVMDAGTFDARFVLASSECAELVDKTRFAISTEETRYYLNGIFLHSMKDNGVEMLRAVATDGHRLARMEIPLPSGASDVPGIIIPRKTVGELRKLMDESDQDVTIEVSENKIRFSAGAITLVSKLIDGTFPDYERVIPKENDRLLEINAKVLREAVDRVSTIASDKSRAIKLICSNNALTLLADSQDHGEAQEVLEVDFQAEEVQIGFNSRYLLEMLSQIEGETVQFAFSDSGSPAVVRDTGTMGALYVIMPMRV